METLQPWLIEKGFGPIVENQALSGGSINSTSMIRTKSGRSFCLKHNQQAPDNFFTCEAQGLATLAATKSFRVPTVFHCDNNYLLLEYIHTNKRNTNYWATLGQQLAKCHLQSQQVFGFFNDNYCGLSQQMNSQTENGFEFFAQHRLLIQTSWARHKHRLTPWHCRQIETLVDRLDEFIPTQQPALIHGDLWNGNIVVDERGDPVIIDPACYWGWPEADLAMTTLFGDFDPAFYKAYEQQRAEFKQPLESGWRERIPLYNLYHLLNHLNLFGASYLPSVESALKQFR